MSIIFMLYQNIRTLLWIAGVGHITLAVGSLLIPRVLYWKDHLSTLPPLFRQMFWVYAGYTLCTNIFFGIISVMGNDVLTDQSFLATALTGFIALYWIARLILQFFYFDRKSTSGKLLYTIGEVSLTILFVYFSFIYSYAFFINV